MLTIFSSLTYLFVPVPGLSLLDLIRLIFSVLPVLTRLTPTGCILLAPLSPEFCWVQPWEVGGQNEGRSRAVSSPLFTSGCLSSRSSLSPVLTQDTCYGPSFCQVMLGFGLGPVLGSNGFPLELLRPPPPLAPQLFYELCNEFLVLNDCFKY